MDLPYNAVSPPRIHKRISPLIRERLKSIALLVAMACRLDGGNGFAGAIITPYYDSMLVKCTCHASTYEIVRRKMLRALVEFRIRGVKTNIPFLASLLTHPTFIEGNCWTTFIDDTPELFKLRWRSKSCAETVGVSWRRCCQRKLNQGSNWRTKIQRRNHSSRVERRKWQSH